MASKVVLFIIDPQVDFHPGGSLAVQGATEDSERIANLINANCNKIDEIYVTLDSHHRNHIAHGVFWEGPDGKSPPPFTLISHSQVEKGEWTPRNPDNLEHALWYTRKLEELNRFKLCIWPEHCLIGSPGHAVVPSLHQALQEWCFATQKTVHYVHKGMNCLTEMYSAIAADVPIESDPSTKTNQALLDELTNTAGKLLVCGEAKSHCVNFTLRDILADWLKKGRDPADITLLSDGCSAVYGCAELADKFESDMRTEGVTISVISEAL